MEVKTVRFFYAISCCSAGARCGCPRADTGKVKLLWDVPLHLGEEVGERAQRDGGRRFAGRAGRRKQESRGGATGERGKSSGYSPQGVVSMTVWFSIHPGCLSASLVLFPGSLWAPPLLCPPCWSLRSSRQLS